MGRRTTGDDPARSAPAGTARTGRVPLRRDRNTLAPPAVIQVFPTGRSAGAHPQEPGAGRHGAIRPSATCSSDPSPSPSTRWRVRRARCRPGSDPPPRNRGGAGSLRPRFPRRGVRFRGRRARTHHAGARGPPACAPVPDARRARQETPRARNGSRSRPEPSDSTCSRRRRDAEEGAGRVDGRTTAMRGGHVSAEGFGGRGAPRKPVTSSTTGGSGATKATFRPRRCARYEVWSRASACVSSIACERPAERASSSISACTSGGIRTSISTGCAIVTSRRRRQV